MLQLEGTTDLPAAQFPEERAGEAHEAARPSGCGAAGRGFHGLSEV